MTPTIPGIEPVPDNLALYRLRDDMARHYQPCGGYEMLLVGRMALACQRMSEALAFERSYHESHDMLDVFERNPKEFEAVLRVVSRAQEAWYRSVRALEMAQKLRKRGFPVLP